MELEFNPPLQENKVEENKEDRNVSREVAAVKSLFNINPEMSQVHEKLTELARRVDRIEQRLPNSWIPQYRMRDDKEYTPLGGVLDQIFNEFDNLYDKLEEAQTQFNNTLHEESKKLS